MRRQHHTHTCNSLTTDAQPSAICNRICQSKLHAEASTCIDSPLLVCAQAKGVLQCVNEAGMSNPCRECRLACMLKCQPKGHGELGEANRSSLLTQPKSPGSSPLRCAGGSLPGSHKGRAAMDTREPLLTARSTLLPVRHLTDPRRDTTCGASALLSMHVASTAVLPGPARTSWLHPTETADTAGSKLKLTNCTGNAFDLRRNSCFKQGRYRRRRAALYLQWDSFLDRAKSQLILAA